MSDHPSHAPFNPLPPIIWLLALPIIAMEVVLSLADYGLIGGAQGVGWRLQALERFAFSPDLMRDMIRLNTYPPQHLLRIVSYPFVQGNLTQAAFVVVFLLALGKMVGEVFRWWGVVVIFFGATLAGALVMTAIPQIQTLLFGGYPSVYGLIGAFTFLLWTRLALTGGNRYGAFSLIGMLMGVQLLFGLIFGASWDWVAELAGFAAGFGLSFLVVPGGWARIRAALRQR